MILAGDIGGTKTTLALFAAGKGDFDRDSALVETFDSRAFAAFDGILHSFRERHPARLRAACIGIAGPVRKNRCAATNLPWVVDGDTLGARLGLAKVRLLNDLEAVGFGIDRLAAREIVELQAGAGEASGNRAVIAAGTGLGEAGLFWDGAAHRPFATEGGHADFAPRNELEIALFEFLRREHARVSWERVLSGPGLGNLASFLLHAKTDPRIAGLAQLEVGADPAHEPQGLADELASSDVGDGGDGSDGGDGGHATDAGAVVARYAAAGTSAVCSRALELFVELYGAEAGNLALKTMATGGLYIGGGIAPRILDRLQRGTFLAAFLDKGRMRPLLEAMPVRVVLNPETALLGAARRAAQDLS